MVGVHREIGVPSEGSVVSSVGTEIYVFSMVMAMVVFCVSFESRTFSGNRNLVFDPLGICYRQDDAQHEEEPDLKWTL